MCLKTDPPIVPESGPEISWTLWTERLPPPATPYFAIGQTHTLGVRNGGNGSRKEIVIEVPKRKGTKQRPPIVEPKMPHSLENWIEHWTS